MHTLPKTDTLSGFTLIELLIVGLVGSLLLGVGIPSYINFNRRETMTSAGLSVKNFLREVQSKAQSGVKPEVANCNSPNTLVGYEINFYTEKAISAQAICSGGPSGVFSFYSLPDTAVYFYSVAQFQFLVLGGGASSGNNEIYLNNAYGVTGSEWYTMCVNARGDVRDCGYITTASEPICSC